MQSSLSYSEGDSSRILVLYHTTSISNAEAILAGRRMYRGSDGSFGGAIYFATTKKDSIRKAVKKGATIKASVRVGKSLVVPNQSDLAKLTFSDLKNSSYDSIRATCFNGDEYIVYNCSQVREIEHVEGLSNFRVCSDIQCARYKKSHYGDCGKICQYTQCKMTGKKHLAKCKGKDNKIFFKTG